ncbi:MAG: hypothetical protein JKY43_00595 [Phycisphaerales bacterium]|nr:hypothetical protein [Phycisphaerales bacterium]
MRTYEEQSRFSAPGALHLVNTGNPLLPPVNNPFQFSDAYDKARSNKVASIDPRRLIAIMTQNRQQSRSSGLISKDTAELIHIGKNLGIAPVHTRQIIAHVLHAPDELYTDLSIHIQVFADIPIGPPIKKTRMPLRVLIGLSIWAITIALAMAMV